MHSNNLRYTELIKPMDAYVAALTPRAKRLVQFLEGGLVLVMLTTVIFYV